MIRSTSSFNAVRRIIGIGEFSARMSRQISRPDPSGNMTSSTINLISFRFQRGVERAPVGRQRHSKSLLRQIPAEQLSNLKVIIDDQNVRFDVHSFSVLIEIVSGR